MLAVSVNRFALLGVLMEDVILLECFKLLQETSTLSHLFADVHRILECLVPVFKYQRLPKAKGEPDWNVKSPASGAEDVRLLEVHLLDQAPGDVPLCVRVHKISSIIKIKPQCNGRRHKTTRSISSKLV